jgi:hypothetical protein
MPDRLYIVPAERVSTGPETFARGPAYFHWKYDIDGPGIRADRISSIYYGFQDVCLVSAEGITQNDHDFLALQPDVYVYPPLDQLDNSITPADPIDAFYESLNIPTDWLTPATTYRQFLRQTLGMWNFNQRYSGISQGGSIFDNADMSTRLRDMSAQEQEWFGLVLDSYGLPRNAVNDNNTLRQILKQGSDWLTGRSYQLGGIVV